MHLELLFAEPATTDTGRRTLSGTAVPFGVPSGPTRNGKKYRFHRPPLNIDDTIDVVREHDRDAVVGRLTAWTPTDTGLDATARMSGTTAGNDALIEASEGIRTGFSVGAEADDDQLTLADDGVYDVGDWTAEHLALVRRPSLAGAGVSRIAASSPVENPEDPATEDDEDTETDADGEGTDQEEDEETMNETIEAAAQVPTEHRRRGSAPRGPRTLIEASQTVAAVHTRGPAAIEAALTDIVPGDGTNGLTGAFLRPEWLGELWTPQFSRRDFVDAVGSRPLTSMTWEGWKWETLPEVQKYTGNKTPVPSGPVTIVPANGEGYRVAGAWDVDRIFLDLGKPDLITSLFEAAAVDYRMKSEAWLASDLIADATALPDAESLVAALNACITALTGVGAHMSWVAMAADLWTAFLELPEAEVPWWLRNQASVNISDSSTTIAGIRIFTNATLPASTVLAGDRNAVDFREAGPLRVNAVNVPNGGIDIGLFGYQGTLVHDARGLVKAVVTPPIGARGVAKK